MQTQSTPVQDSWEAILGLPKPATCNLKAACCSVATPSLPVDELIARAVAGDATCRDFLNVFVPHLTPEDAKAFYPEGEAHIDRVLNLVQNAATRGQTQASRVVFYHCQYLGADKRCQIYEDRPTFCRTYPTSPLNILIKGCGYESWAQACKAKLRALGYETAEDD
ncbi:MAG: YkgJ family cysteine cluster protein [Vampirovibrionales bacterium]|nr:YkgJ family cysteine cluster protein [Vampirovibrionales bacterium]